jgi:hypothetical protein
LIDQTLGGLAPFLGRGRGREIEEALQQVADWVLPPADAEIEDEAPIGAKAPRFREGPHLLDESGLADAGLATHVNDMAGAPTKRGLQDALELFKLGLAADKDASTRRGRGFSGYTAQPPDTDRRVDSLS